MSTLGGVVILLIGMRVSPALAGPLDIDLEKQADIATLADARDIERYRHMGLEQLMNEEVTTVTGVAEEWFRSPASVYVIGNEEVRRSGAQTLAEALRLAPGVFVGQSASNRWQVGTRGFNGALANKTLVLIDGRAVYDPLFGGTFWDVQDVLLEDLDRIEVIRGPGTTLWGANAMNGVFNITTRSARDTQGFFATALTGTWQQGMGAVRYGAAIDDDTWFRVWSKYSVYDNFDQASGRNNYDAWDMYRGGFRVDHDGADGGHLMVDADYYTGFTSEYLNSPIRGASFVFRPVTPDEHVDGGHLLARLSREDKATGSGWSLQGYYDRTQRVIYNGLDVTRNTFDLDFRNHFKLFDRNEIVWGVEGRYTEDVSEPGQIHELIPPSRGLKTINGFVQDTYSIVPNRLFFLIGSKLEYNDYIGAQLEPNARLWWTPDDKQTVWAAVSRAVRIPSRLEHDGVTAFAYVDVGGGNIVPFGVRGDESDNPEVMWAYEGGYRRKITDDITLDLSLFYNDYDRFIFLPPGVLGAFTFGSAETYGGELAVTWRVAPNWRLQGGYSYVDVQTHKVFPQDEGNTPENMAQLRSYYNITDRLELNANLFYVDNVQAHHNPHYLRLDVGITWHVTNNLEIAAWGQNLLDPRHPEFTDPLHTEANVAEVPRAFYIQATIRF